MVTESGDEEDYALAFVLGKRRSGSATLSRSGPGSASGSSSGDSSEDTADDDDDENEPPRPRKKARIAVRKREHGLPPPPRPFACLHCRPACPATPCKVLNPRDWRSRPSTATFANRHDRVHTLYLYH